MGAPANTEAEATADEDFFTPDELAAYLRISRKTVYGLIRDGVIPGVKRLKRILRIYRPAVLEWAAADKKQRQKR
ncbi:helix-turn-helix domain-containing protein [Sorangium sp. So ce1036]|uniref:helix-turn-helix domain-containing protein n=1 Tax=Sorangium sp. So ce1036 TaxID=3133328 RepID=UPI003F025241